MPAPGSAALIDAVNDANEPVGLVPRGEVFRLGANFRTVHVLVFNSDGELLLQRLAATRERHPLKWGSSVAGYLHAGEDYHAAAVRRLREELALETALQPIGVSAMADAEVTKFIGVFTTVADSPQVNEPDHIADVQFWALDDLDRTMRTSENQFTDSLRHVLSHWRRHREGDGLGWT